MMEMATTWVDIINMMTALTRTPRTMAIKGTLGHFFGRGVDTETV